MEDVARQEKEKGLFNQKERVAGEIYDKEIIWMVE